MWVLESKISNVKDRASPRVFAGSHVRVGFDTHRRGIRKGSFVEILQHIKPTHPVDYRLVSPFSSLRPQHYSIWATLTMAGYKDQFCDGLFSLPLP